MHRKSRYREPMRSGVRAATPATGLTLAMPATGGESTDTLRRP